MAAAAARRGRAPQRQLRGDRLHHLRRFLHEDLHDLRIQRLGRPRGPGFRCRLCREATGFSGHLTEFSEMFADIFSPIPSMIALQRDLRARRIPTFIFSNTNEFAVTHIRKRFPFFSEFDGYVLSYQHGAMKPDPRLYAVVEQVTGRRGPELLYLDDRPENVNTPRTMGWQAIEHRDPAESLAAVRAAGLLR